MSAFVIVQHAGHEGPGLLDEVLKERGKSVRLVRRDAGDPLPDDAGDVRALVVLGGHEAAGQAADDGSVALLARCLDAGVPVLALSAGARLLARAGGGGLGEPRGPAGAGFLRVARTEAGADDPMFHSLVDGASWFVSDPAVLDLPDGATRLAAHESGTPQAFLLGANAYGVQWHPELSGRAVAEYVINHAVRAHLTGLGCDLEALADEARRRDPFVCGLGAALLGRWVDAVVGRTEAEAPWGRKGPPPVPRPGLSLNPA